MKIKDFLDFSKRVVFILGLISFSNLIASDSASAEAPLFKLSPGQEVKFSPWKEGEPYIIRHSGFINDEKNPEEKIYKLEIEFKNFSSIVIGIPVEIPVEGPLKSSLTYRTESNKEFSCSWGFLADIRPGFSGYVAATAAPPREKFNKIEINDLFERCKITGIPVVSKKYYNDTTPENFTAYLTHISLFIRSAQGSIVTIYIKDLEISGKTPSPYEMKKLIAERWAPAKAKLLEKISKWKTKIADIKKNLENKNFSSTETNNIRTQVLKKLDAFDKRLSLLEKDGFLKAVQEEKILADLNELTSINLTDLDNYFQTAKGAKYIPYIVSPTSDKKILPDDIYISNSCATTLNINATPGEFEPASFVIHAVADINKVKAETSALKTESGQSIPSSCVDIKIVKCWFQAGTAWISTNQMRNKKVMVPELLLNDPQLIKVDTKKKENYLKLVFPEGEKYVWISNPEEESSGPYKIVSVKDFPVKDSPVLLPVDIPANSNQQFWITIKVPEDTSPGNYKGKISLFSDGTPLSGFEVNLNVLPFKLDAPVYISSIYYRAYLSEKYPDGTISSEPKSESQLAAELKNMSRHGIYNPTFYQSFKNKKLLNKYMELREAAGITPQALYYCYGIDVECNKTEESKAKLEKRIKDVLEYFKPYGINDVYFYGRDEATAEKLMEQRRSWDAIHEAGGKVFVAGILNENFEKMGDIQDLLICAGQASKEEAAKWHSKNHKIWCYNGPQGGVENPAIYRRNFGIQLWQNNYDGACTFAYQQSYGNIWNDFDGHFREECFTYPTIDGVIDTIAWEGYREAIDDVKYISTLVNTIEKIKQGNNAAKLKTLAKAEKYLRELKTADIMTLDLDKMRSEISEYIVELQK